MLRVTPHQMQASLETATTDQKPSVRAGTGRHAAAACEHRNVKGQQDELSSDGQEGFATAIGSFVT